MWETEKLLVMSNFSFCHSVFKRLVPQTCEIQGFSGKGLNFGRVICSCVLPLETKMPVWFFLSNDRVSKCFKLKSLEFSLS